MIARPTDCVSRRAGGRFPREEQSSASSIVPSPTVFHRPFTTQRGQKCPRRAKMPAAGKNARGGQKCPRRAKTPGFSRARFLFRAFLGAILCALIPCLHPASKWRDFGIKRKRPYSRVVCVDTPPGCRRRRRRRRGSFQSSDWSRLEPGTHRRVMTRRTVRLESGAPGFESKAKTTIPITSVLILIRATNVNHGY